MSPVVEPIPPVLTLRGKRPPAFILIKIVGHEIILVSQLPDYYSVIANHIYSGMGRPLTSRVIEKVYLSSAQVTSPLAPHSALK